MDKGARSGEAAERARSRRYWAVAILGVAFGAFTGSQLWRLTGGDLSGTLPGWWAMLLAALYVAMMVGGSWYFFRTVDELEVRDNLLAGMIGAGWYITIYPVWFFLWKGGLVIEPSHEMLFVSTLLVLAIAYLVKKIRP